MTTTNATIAKSTAKPRDKTTASRKKSTAVASGKKTNHGPGKTKPAARTESKLQTCLGLLNSTEGATIDELMAATGWQAHSVRGFLAGTVKKKLNLVLESSKAPDGVRRYHVMNAGA